MEQFDVVVVGAGASGLCAGIEARKCGASCLILEQKEKAGKKLYATGNGRCNLGNLHMEDSCYHGSNPALIPAVVGEDTPGFVISYFSSLGLCIKDANDYLYPQSEQASAVVSTLLETYLALGGELRLHAKVKDARDVLMTGFEVTYDSEEEEKKETVSVFGKKLILATGGKSQAKLGSDGSGYTLAKKLDHTVIPPRPALCALVCEDLVWKRLKGVRVKAAVSLRINDREVAREQGELQFTDYGLSGIAVFNLSGRAGAALEKKDEVKLCMHLLDSEDMKAMYHCFKTARDLCPERSVGSVLSSVLPEKLLMESLRTVGVDPEMPSKNFDDATWKRWFNLCADWQVNVVRTNGFEASQVTAGGVVLSEVDLSTMESKLCDGLYLTGEILDADGICGGYNLMWAWTTGIRAGRAAGGKRA